MSSQNFKWTELTMGVCYYPEHWDKSLWKSDLERMKNVGIRVVRIGEFAWSKIEREEGVFDFGFFDSFLDLCKEMNMNVIFGTPTATPPAWVTATYPEVLNCRIDGVSYQHGGRRHYNYNSPKYLELCTRIVTMIAKHYGRHPSIVGWQIDNELNCEVDEFYSESDNIAFRNFLLEKYENLDELNRAWGTVFWNQTYTDWNQVYIPRVIPGASRNPHQHLDYIRFISESVIRFCKVQAEILHKYCDKKHFITTNGRFGHIDNHRMEQECLDVYTYDSYPNMAFQIERNKENTDDLNDRRCAMYLNEVRSVCPHFGIMEQQSGANGWTTCMESPAPRPGQLTLWTMQSVAYGADFISYFRWRTCTIGPEIYWHGILDYDNRDNRKLKEVGEVSQKLNAINEICGADFSASFALVKDYDNEWDSVTDVWHKRVSAASEDGIFRAAELGHIPYDVLYLSDYTTLEDLKRYSVLIYPHPVITTAQRVDLLEAYVRQGGTIIFGCRSGYKDMNGQCVMMPQPGLLGKLTGTDIQEFTLANPVEPMVTMDYQGEILETPIFQDILTPMEETTVLASYQGSYFKGEAALTERRLGQGKVLHFGSTFSKENTAALLRCVGVVSPFTDYVQASEEVELVMRCKDDNVYIFVLNYNAFDVEFELKKQMLSMFDSKSVIGKIALPSYGTAVYVLKNQK